MGLMIPSLDFDLPLMAAQRVIRTCHILNVCVKRHPRTLGFLIFFLNVDRLFFSTLVSYWVQLGGFSAVFSN